MQCIVVKRIVLSHLNYFTVNAIVLRTVVYNTNDINVGLIYQVLLFFEYIMVRNFNKY